MTRNAGVLTFFSAFWRPLRTSWLIVGNSAPYYTRKVGHTIGETELWEYSKEFRDRQMIAKAPSRARRLPAFGRRTAGRASGGAASLFKEGPLSNGRASPYNPAHLGEDLALRVPPAAQRSHDLFEGLPQYAVAHALVGYGEPPSDARPAPALAHEPPLRLKVHVCARDSVRCNVEVAG